MSLLEHHVATTGCVLKTGSGVATDLHIILLVEGIMPSSNRYAFHQPSLSYPLFNKQLHNHTFRLNYKQTHLILLLQDSAYSFVTSNRSITVSSLSVRGVQLQSLSNLTGPCLFPPYITVMSSLCTIIRANKILYLELYHFWLPRPQIWVHAECHHQQRVCEKSFIVPLSITGWVQRSVSMGRVCQTQTY